MRKIALALMLMIVFVFSASVLLAATVSPQYTQGMQFYNSGKYDKAITALKEYVRTTPDPKAYYFIGYAYYNLGKQAEAQKYFDYAYLMDPSYSPELKKRPMSDAPALPPIKTPIPQAQPATPAPAPAKAAPAAPAKAVPAPAPAKAAPPAPAPVKAAPTPVPAAPIKAGTAPATPVAKAPAVAPAVPGKAGAPAVTPPAPVAPVAPAVKPAAPTVAAPGAPSVTPPAAPAAPSAQPAPAAAAPKPATPKPRPIAPPPPQESSMGGVVVLVMLGIALAIYLFFAFCLFKIAQKLGIDKPWFAFIPFLQNILLAKAADKSVVLGIVSIFIPFIIIWFLMIISEKLGKGKVFGLIAGVLLMLTGILGMVMIAILAFKGQASGSSFGSGDFGGDEGMPDLSAEPNVPDLDFDLGEDGAGAEPGMADAEGGDDLPSGFDDELSNDELPK